MKHRETKVPSNAPAAIAYRRWKERAVTALDAPTSPLMVKMALGMFQGGRFEWMRHFPALPRWTGGWETPRIWSRRTTPAPPALRSWDATVRDPEREREAFEERPLHNFNQTHAETVLWTLRRSWPWLLATFPRLIGAVRALRQAEQVEVASIQVEVTPAVLSQRIREHAQTLGMSEVGFAKADVRYTFAENEDPGDANIIVCVMEQDWAATQTAPSSRAERAAFRGYGQMFPIVAELVEYIKAQGYEARANDWGSLEAIAIHYGEQAGLGQLGLNGQLLTPMAGSRARLGLITTNAPVELGKPIDHGIPKICDSCQLCVRRCPSGAIPKKRADKRGVIKAAIKPERCFPVLAQTHGCAVCIKTCPIQRYGLDAVQERFLETGEILGKGTDQLEGYVWPLDGRFYGSGEKPKMTSDIIKPEGWPFDKDRVSP